MSFRRPSPSGARARSVTFSDPGRGRGKSGRDQSFMDEVISQRGPGQPPAPPGSIPSGGDPAMQASANAFFGLSPAQKQATINRMAPKAKRAVKFLYTVAANQIRNTADLAQNATTVLSAAETIEDETELRILFESLYHALRSDFFKGDAGKNPERLGAKAVLSKAKNVIAERVRSTYREAPPPKLAPGEGAFYPNGRYTGRVMNNSVGSPESLAFWGKSADSANFDQLANRSRYGYTGSGAYLSEAEDDDFSGVPAVERHPGMNSDVAYDGEGGFFGSMVGNLIGKGIGKVFGKEAGAIAEDLGSKMVSAAENQAVDHAVKWTGNHEIAKGLGDLYKQTGTDYQGSGAYWTQSQVPGGWRFRPERGLAGTKRSRAEFDDEAYTPQTDPGYLRTAVGPARGEDDYYDQVDFVNMRNALRDQMVKSGQYDFLDLKNNEGYGQPGLKMVTETSINTNALIDPNKLFSKQPPQIQTSPDEMGNLEYRGREFLEDVTSHADWTDASRMYTLWMWDINAGLTESFPLLSQFAQLYGQYKFRQLIYRFRSQVTPGNAVAAGTIILVTLYNPHEAPPVDKRDAENTGYATSGSVCNTLVAGVECNPKKMAMTDFLYTRQGPVPNKEAYDLARFMVCCQGLPPGFNAGEMWVEYRCCLSKQNVSQVKPLLVGEGMNLSSLVILPRAMIHTTDGMWFGKYAAAATPSGYVPLEYPLPEWRAMDLAAPSTLASVLQASGLAQNPGVLTSMAQGQTSFSSLDPTSNGNFPMIQAWTQSRNVTALYARAGDLGPGGSGIRIQFQSLLGATYSISLILGVVGSQAVQPTGATPPPPIGAMTIDPIPSNPTGPYGAATFTVLSGMLRIGQSANLGMQTKVQGGLAWTNVGSGLTSIANNFVALGETFTATGAGSCSISMTLDSADFNRADVNVTSVAFSFVRIS